MTTTRTPGEQSHVAAKLAPDRPQADRPALTRSDWRELNRLIDARENALTEFATALRRDSFAADSGPYEAAIRELWSWMDEHTDWGAA